MQRKISHLIPVGLILKEKKQDGVAITENVRQDQMLLKVLRL